MKRNTIVLVPAFLFLLCVSCNQREKETEIDSFSHSCSIVGCASAKRTSSIALGLHDNSEQITSYDSIFSDKKEPMGQIVNMKVYGNLLILAHANGEYNFSFIDLRTKEVVRRWGQIGNGPDELLDFENHFFVQDSCLTFMSFPTKKLIRVPIKEILEGRIPLGIRRDSIPYTRDFRPLKVCPMGDLKVAVGCFEEGMLGIINAEGDIAGTYFNYPFEYPQLQGIFRGTTFQSLIDTNNQGKFVVSMISSDAFTIYRMDGIQPQKIYAFPFRHTPQILEKGGRFTIDFRNSIAGIMNMATSEQLIGFTYSAKTYEEMSMSGMVSDEILCFDWSGRKVKKYQLPFAVSTFCLDKEYIYFVRAMEADEETMIYRFKL